MTAQRPPSPTDADRLRAAADASVNLPALAVRGGVGGLLMGLANLVPGISGGTMLLAAGVYPRFIEAISEVTRLRFSRISLVVLGSVGAAALAAIILLAGPVKTLVVEYRWVMYSLFIGLSLGGVPSVWRLIRRPLLAEFPEHDPAKPGDRGMRAVWFGAALGFAGMAALAWLQASGVTGDVRRDEAWFLLFAGIAGASAMILPGISGGYLLLVLGVYVPILAGVDAFKEGLRAGNLDVILNVGLRVVLPVGVGVVLGVVAVSNLLRWLLHRFEKLTLGCLLGLLVGAVVGLWPFQHAVAPREGQLIKGRPIALAEGDGAAPGNEPRWVFAESGEPVDREDLPTEFFTPSPLQVATSLALVALGLATTLLIDRWQGSRD